MRLSSFFKSRRLGSAASTWAASDAIGAWQRMHLASMAAFWLGVWAASAVTTARQKGSRDALAIMVPCQRLNGAMGRSSSSRMAVAAVLFEWHRAQAVLVKNRS